jgi:carbamoylphosphate synthase large subunit
MKNFKILVGKHGRKSTKMLFEKITNPNTEHVLKSTVLNAFVYRTNKENLRLRKIVKGFKSPDCKNSIVARWGWYGEIETDNTSIVYNKAEAIKLSNSKGQCRKFLESKGIDVPKTYLLNEPININSFPLIARPEHHGQGKNLWLCENFLDLEEAMAKGATYFSHVYPKTEEYGVHVAHGKVLAVVKKPAPDDLNQIAWNRAQNDKPFELIPQAEYKNYICKLALRAFKEIGLDYGRADVMVQKTDKNLPKAVICELNTAPTLTSTPYVLERWTKYFNKLANSDKRIEHWDFEQFEKAESLAWKENQLLAD